MIQDLIDSSTASGLSNVPKTQHIYSDDTATRLARALLLNILPIHRRALSTNETLPWIPWAIH